MDEVIALTQDQVEKIRGDNEQVEMLTDTEINAIAQNANAVINIPFLGEEKEFVVIAKMVRLIDRKIYEVLPNEYYELIKDSLNGVSEEEAENIGKRLAPIINGLVNIPILSEKQEQILIELVLGLIIKGMVKGFKLDESAVVA